MPKTNRTECTFQMFCVSSQLSSLNSFPLCARGCAMVSLFYFANKGRRKGAINDWTHDTPERKERMKEKTMNKSDINNVIKRFDWAACSERGCIAGRQGSGTRSCDIRRQLEAIVRHVLLSYQYRKWFRVLIARLLSLTMLTLLSLTSFRCIFNCAQ